MPNIVRKQRTIKTTVKAPVKPVAVEAKPSKTTKATAERVTHNLDFQYAGASPVTTTRRSKTALRADEFGTVPDLILSDRDHSLMSPLKQKYGTKAFQRGDLDAGILNRLIRKGVVRHVSGEVTDSRAQLAFVK